MGRDDKMQSVGIFQNRLKKTPPTKHARAILKDHLQELVSEQEAKTASPTPGGVGFQDFVTLTEARERAERVAQEQVDQAFTPAGHFPYHEDSNLFHDDVFRDARGRPQGRPRFEQAQRGPNPYPRARRPAGEGFAASRDPTFRYLDPLFLKNQAWQAAPGIGPDAERRYIDPFYRRNKWNQAKQNSYPREAKRPQKATSEDAGRSDVRSKFESHLAGEPGGLRTELLGSHMKANGRENKITLPDASAQHRTPATMRKGVTDAGLTTSSMSPANALPTFTSEPKKPHHRYQATATFAAGSSSSDSDDALAAAERHARAVGRHARHAKTQQLIAEVEAARKIAVETHSHGKTKTIASPFDKLPPEIRHLIYCQLLLTSKTIRGGELVKDRRTTVVVPDDRPAAMQLGIDATFLRTCRKMYYEALPILYKDNTFGFSEVSMLKIFRRKGLPKENLSSPMYDKPRFAFKLELQGRLCLLRKVHIRFDHSPLYRHVRRHQVHYPLPSSLADHIDDWSAFLNEERYSNSLLDDWLAFPALDKLILDFTDWKLDCTQGLRVRLFVDKFRGANGLRHLITIGLSHNTTIDAFRKELLGRGGTMEVLGRHALRDTF